MTERNPADDYIDEHTLRTSSDPHIADYPDSYLEIENREVSINVDHTIVAGMVRSCLVMNQDDEPGMAIQLAGSVGPDGEDAAVTCIMSIESAAAMVAQITEIAVASNEETAQTFHTVLAGELRRQAFGHSEATRKAAQNPCPSCEKPRTYEPCEHCGHVDNDKSTEGDD